MHRKTIETLLHDLDVSREALAANVSLYPEQTKAILHLAETIWVGLMIFAEPLEDTASNTPNVHPYDHRTELLARDLDLRLDRLEHRVDAIGRHTGGDLPTPGIVVPTDHQLIGHVNAKRVHDRMAQMRAIDGAPLSPHRRQQLIDELQLDMKHPNAPSSHEPWPMFEPEFPHFQP